MSARTGYRPVRRPDGWGVTHRKAPWREAAAHLRFATRPDAQRWIAEHRARLERIANTRRTR